MSLERLINKWEKDPDIQKNVAAWRIFPSRQAITSDFPADLNDFLVNNLQGTGIFGLYHHQAKVWEEVKKGHNVVISIGTASGKSLAYNLPIINGLISSPDQTALYLFPTKALANDQFTKLRDFFRGAKFPLGQLGYLHQDQVGTYDGDTSPSQRAKTRASVRILLTNPDMLHVGILPYHPRWSRYFSGLRYVVIDEVHTYRGVFGSHIGNVLRRLLRIAAFYGSTPKFVFTSATIANPNELCTQLINQPVVEISEDTSAKSEKHFILYNPPLVNPELGLRRGILYEASLFGTELFDEGLHTLIFARTRRSIEVLLRSLRDSRSEGVYAGSIRGYRSGYLANQRREIEEAIRSGKARVVVSTNALELGVDIGELDVVILAGYPGTIASTWQQAGRAGRLAEKSALILCILGSNPLDQFLAKHPEFFFERSPEKALINPNHLLILYHHMQCAAYELPFQDGDTFGSFSPAEIQDLLNLMVEQKIVHYSAGRFTWISDAFPAASISLRSTGADQILIQNRERTIGEIDEISSYWMLHPEAIYLHEGNSYFVLNLDLQKKIAEVEEISSDFYTEPKVTVTLQVVSTESKMPTTYGEKLLGELSVTRQITGYNKIQWASFTKIGGGELSLPPVEFQTTGYWFTIDERIVSVLRSEGLWLNDPNNYGPLWPNIRSLARARDSYRCQVCGAIENKTAFHVHHKTPFRMFNSADEANKLSNLVTLCPNCHKKVEQNLRIRSGLSGLGYILHNLAPLFLMCDQSDLGVYSDAQSTVAAGNPAISIYEAIPAGIGLSKELFGLHEKLVLHALELVDSCQCQDGCPSCVGPGGENGRGSKTETRALLEMMNAPH